MIPTLALLSIPYLVVVLVWIGRSRRRRRVLARDMHEASSLDPDLTRPTSSIRPGSDPLRWEIFLDSPPPAGRVRDAWIFVSGRVAGGAITGLTEASCIAIVEAVGRRLVPRLVPRAGSFLPRELRIDTDCARHFEVRGVQVGARRQLSADVVVPAEILVSGIVEVAIDLIGPDDLLEVTVANVSEEEQEFRATLRGSYVPRSDPAPTPSRP